MSSSQQQQRSSSTVPSTSSIQKTIKSIVVTIFTMAFRLFGRIMDRYTAIRYGTESASTVTSLKEIIDKDIFGNEVKVRVVFFIYEY